jgi:hypothetical protein
MTVIIALTAIFGAYNATAGRFINLVETAALPTGEGEVVQAAAFSTCSGMPCRSDVLEFQMGVEYGLFNRFHVGFALPNVATSWTHEAISTEVGGTSFWGLYNFIDSGDKGWGLSGAVVFTEGPHTRSGEAALLFEKPVGSWVLVYNGVAGRSWAHLEEFGVSDGMSHSLGTSYEVTPTFFLGLEADWYLANNQGWESAGRYMGPNLSVDMGQLWITASAQFAIGPEEVIPNQVLQTQIGLPF